MDAPCNNQMSYEHPNGRGKYPNNSYVEELENIKSWRIKNTMDNITCDGTEWCCCPKHNMSVKFDVMYMNHPHTKNDGTKKMKIIKRHTRN